MRPPPDPTTSPFSPPVGAKPDKLISALTETAWEAFYAADALIAKAMQVGIPIKVTDLRILAHTIVDAVRAVTLADPDAIYAAAGGMGDIYDTVARQGQNLSNRHTAVGLDWTGRAADVFEGYHTSVLDLMFRNNQPCVAQYLLDTSTYLVKIADGVIDMRTNLAVGACAVAEKGLEAIKAALSEIEADERDLAQEILDGVFSDATATGLQVATEIAQDVLGAIDVGITGVQAAVQFLGSAQQALGQATSGDYLSSAHTVGTTSPWGDAPPDYGDYRQWRAQ